MIFARIWDKIKPKASTEKDKDDKRKVQVKYSKQDPQTQTGQDVTRGIDVNKYKQELRTNGIHGIENLLTKDSNTLRNEIEIHIAVTGASGSGKSSFVNSIRGLKARDPDAAKVGVFEATLKRSLYHHPQNKSFVVWDLPGVGTPSFPKENYLEAIGYEKYDFFIIMSKSRFTENDLWLAREIQNLNKTFFFVHSNIDKDIDNDREDNPENHMEEKVIQEIKTKTECELKENGVENPNVFLINNRKTDTYDFGMLQNKMLLSIDSLKKESLVLTLSAITKEFIEEKKTILQKKIYDVASMIACKQEENERTRICQDVIQFYEQQLHIDAQSSDITDKVVVVPSQVSFTNGKENVSPLPVKNEKVYEDYVKKLKLNLELLYKKSIDSYDTRNEQLVDNILPTRL